MNLQLIKTVAISYQVRVGENENIFLYPHSNLAFLHINVEKIHSSHWYCIP